MVYRYVLDRLAGKDGLAPGRKVDARGRCARFEHENRVLGARAGPAGRRPRRRVRGRERRGRLRRADGVGRAQQHRQHRLPRLPGVLEARRRPRRPQWQVPFDADHPLTTPRDLDENNPQVVQAMSRRDRLPARRRTSPCDARWGSLQVAGDDGAPPIPIGGGEGYAGQRQRRGQPDARGQHRPPLPGVLRVLPHPGGRRSSTRGVKANTILTYSPVDRPDVAVLRGPDPAVLAGEVGDAGPSPPRRSRRHRDQPEVVRAAR